MAKILRGSSELHAGCPGKVFEEMKTFCEKVLILNNTGFRAKYSHSWTTFSEVYRKFNLSVMKNVLRKRLLSEGKNLYFFGLRAEKVPFWLEICGSVVRTTLNLSDQKSEEINFFRKITFFSVSAKLEENSLGFNKNFFATTVKAALDGSTKIFGGFFLLLSLIKKVFHLFQTSSKKIGF